MRPMTPRRMLPCALLLLAACAPPGGADDGPELDGTMGWLADLWRDILGASVDGPEADFFALGGGSLSAAQLVAALRNRYPQVTVAQLYDHPRLGSLAGFLWRHAPGPEERPARCDWASGDSSIWIRASRPRWPWTGNSRPSTWNWARRNGPTRRRSPRANSAIGALCAPA